MKDNTVYTTEARAIVDGALQRLIQEVRPQPTHQLVSELRHYAVVYAMDDALLCVALRQAAARLEAGGLAQ